MSSILFFHHSRENGNFPRIYAFWIPACAGMTTFFEAIKDDIHHLIDRKLRVK